MEKNNRELTTQLEDLRENFVNERDQHQALKEKHVELIRDYDAAKAEYIAAVERISIASNIQQKSEKELEHLRVRF